MFIDIENLIVFSLQLFLLFSVYKSPIRNHFKLIIFIIILFEYTTVFIVFGNKLNYFLSFVKQDFTPFC